MHPGGEEGVTGAGGFAGLLSEEKFGSAGRLFSGNSLLSCDPQFPVPATEQPNSLCWMSAEK